MKHLRLFLPLFSFLLSSGCQARNVFPLPMTFSPFLIGLPADLSYQFESAILDCAKNIPGGSVQTNTFAEPYPDPAEFKLLIWQGNLAQYQTLNTDGFTSKIIRTEEIVVIVSLENNLTSLPLTDLRSFFVGKIQDWSVLPLSGLSGQIEFRVYYDSHPLRIILEDVLFGELTIATSALITPAQAEVNAITEDTVNSLSYIGKSQSSDNTRILPVSGIQETPTLSTFVIFQDTEESFFSPMLDCLLKNNQ